MLIFCFFKISHPEHYRNKYYLPKFCRKHHGSKIILLHASFWKLKIFYFIYSTLGICRNFFASTYILTNIHRYPIDEIPFDFEDVKSFLKSQLKNIEMQALTIKIWGNMGNFTKKHRKSLSGAHLLHGLLRWKMHPDNNNFDEKSIYSFNKLPINGKICMENSN